MECWTLLAALAARLGAAGDGAARDGAGRLATAGDGGGGEPFRLGTLVTRAGLRPPALLAHMAATVARVAGGPLIVGIGMGDAANRAENEAFGLPYHHDPVRRAAELVDSVSALGRPGDGSAVAAVWVGGRGHRARGLAARLANAWNGWGLTPEELAAAMVEVRRAAEEAGRDPAEVAGTWAGQVLVGEDAAEARALLSRWGAGQPAEDVGRTVAGDPATVVARLAELGEAGARWCVVAPVGGSGAAMRALLAEAAALPPRPPRAAAPATAP
jgi:alkanesulfonate monooxygenase SsuD/methylene tetrahydromethanopterin reductase-like flavin-dependent oxidoreductase (luciferase family)